MSHRQLPITKTVFDESDYKAVVEPLRSGWVVQGPNVQKFEGLFAEFSGTKHAVAVTSCTTALHLGLLAAGIGPGDEVIIPSFTYVASANAVEYCGARPVFCDIDIHTFNIDPGLIEEKITRATKAVMAVSLFGLCADLDAIDSICQKHNLVLIEDGACAMGSKISGKHSGNWGIGAAFSFHPRKVISTGEGGMFVTNNKAAADKIRTLRDHGASKTDLERHMSSGGSLLPEFNTLGYNYRLTDIQGALGVSQMNKAADIIQGRKEASELYRSILDKDTPLKLPHVPQNHTHGYQSFVTLFTNNVADIPGIDEVAGLNIKRNRLMNHFEKNGVSVRQGTHAVHTLGYYQKKYHLKNEDYPNSFTADRLSLTLPLFVGLSAEDVEFVRDQLKEGTR